MGFAMCIACGGKSGLHALNCADIRAMFMGAIKSHGIVNAMKLAEAGHLPEPVFAKNKSGEVDYLTAAPVMQKRNKRAKPKPKERKAPDYYPKALELLDDGMTYREAVKWLTENGYTTRTGDELTVDALSMRIYHARKRANTRVGGAKWMP